MKRYFIYTFYYSHSYGGSSGTGYVITNGCFPSKRYVLTKNRIPSNCLNVCAISEVKSAQDITDFLGMEVKDVVNLPSTI